MKLFFFATVFLVFIASSFAALEIDVNCEVTDAREVTRDGKTFKTPDVSRYQLEDTPEGVRFS